MKLIKSKLFSCLALIAMAGFIGAAHAVTPPPAQSPIAAKLLFSLTLPTTRTDATPLAANEIGKTRFYVTSFASVLEVGSAVTAYSYALPAGVCVAATDKVAATVVDTDGRESPASVSVNTPALCGPKSLPSPPTGVTATAG